MGVVRHVTGVVRDVMGVVRHVMGVVRHVMGVVRHVMGEIAKDGKGGGWHRSTQRMRSSLHGVALI